MKNFVFISPNFPANYWIFCRELKKNGLNVLGIGDQPYEELSQNLKDSLSEYYKVSSLENYDEVYRAVAFLIFHHGPIDWLESNNEYWLERDARLRTAFHITTGFQEEDIPNIKFKSKMKAFYQQAGIPTAAWQLSDTLENALSFVEKTGYPIVAKPDNGVGASHTYKIETEDQLREFFQNKEADVTYIMEEYIFGEVNSYDAIFDSEGNPLFETGNVTPVSIMDIVNHQDNALFYILKDLPEDTRIAGRATARSFGVKSRFVHFEFFRLQKDQEGVGKKGQLIGLEVNMRPSGGFSPDMINFAHNTDVYKIWADMVAFDKTEMQPGKDSYCAFTGRRDFRRFALSHQEILDRYSGQIKMADRLPAVLASAMGDQIYIACFEEEDEMNRFFDDVLREAGADSSSL